MNCRPLLPLVLATLLGGCTYKQEKSASRVLAGNWNVQADNYTADWTFYPDGRFQYERKQNVTSAKVEGTYRLDGDTVKLTPVAVKAAGARFEKNFQQSQLIQPSAMALGWKDKDAFDATLTTADQTLHFRRR